MQPRPAAQSTPSRRRLLPVVANSLCSLRGLGAGAPRPRRRRHDRRPVACSAAGDKHWHRGINSVDSGPAGRPPTTTWITPESLVWRRPRRVRARCGHTRPDDTHRQQRRNLRQLRSTHLNVDISLLFTGTNYNQAFVLNILHYHLSFLWTPISIGGYLRRDRERNTWTEHGIHDTATKA